MAANERMNKNIAGELGTGKRTVCLWRRRFAEAGLAGVAKDAPRGKKRGYSDITCIPEYPLFRPRAAILKALVGPADTIWWATL